MTVETTFYRDLAYVFGAAVAGGVVARLLRQPLILGYVLGGIAVGPFTPGLTVSDIHEFELLAEVGVILLMYSIGLEFSRLYVVRQECGKNLIDDLLSQLRRFDWERHLDPAQ